MGRRRPREGAEQSEAGKEGRKSGAMDERRVLSDQSDHSRKRGRIKTAAGREGKGGWVGAEREKEREREESSIVEMMGRDSQQAHRTQIGRAHV